MHTHPVSRGSDLHSGPEAIRAFYEASAGTIIMQRSGPVRVAGSEAATPIVILMGPEGTGQKALDIISTMEFDEGGKIAKMRAY
jgi:steroid delta-isomerase